MKIVFLGGGHMLFLFFYFFIGLLWSVILVAIRSKLSKIKKDGGFALSLSLTVLFWWVSMYLMALNKVSKRRQVSRHRVCGHEFDYIK